MNQPFFVVEFAQSVNGQVRRVQISYRSLAYVVASLLAVCLLIFGLFWSYLHTSWEVSRYNQLRADFERLRQRYQELRRQSLQHNEQMASLEDLASEVSAAYGIHPPVSAGNREIIDPESSLQPSVKESIQEFNFLRTAMYSDIYHRYAFQWQSHTQPSFWPVNGILRSSFGGRNDPFSGEGAFHTGIDLEAARGTPVHVTADGVVESAGWSSGYGKLVVVDHGNGIDTYYAHLSQFMVVPGEEVRRGEVIALSGGTGRVTGPHIHYEVRLHGTPVNPYKYMSRVQISQRAKPRHNDLGL
ncbi:MAG TPA: M23 family metallopeptidase [Bryobacteraceae bacterium]|jgi:murein DD-endopeptidase MepM/ murein hydrolase activator NlpD